MKTTTQPKTINALLAEGQRILAEQERRQREVAEKATADACLVWTELRTQAIEDLGELAESLPTEPPEDFAPCEEEWVLRFCPWGGPALFIRYEKINGHGAWSVLSDCDDHGRRGTSFRVEIEFVPLWEVEAPTPAWHVYSVSWHDTDNLAEALAVCHRAMKAYSSCERECQKREPPRNTP